MSSDRKFTVEIIQEGEVIEAKEKVIANIQAATFRATLDALTYFHSTLESELDKDITMEELNNLLFPHTIESKMMEAILRNNPPYAQTYHIYQRDHETFFSPEERQFYDKYMKIYNKKCELYTEKISKYLEEKAAAEKADITTRSFTVKIRGREITENVITDEKTAIYRANVDALTGFHSEVEFRFKVVVTIDDINTFFDPTKIGTQTMDLILQKNAPYAITYHIYDRDHEGFFSPEENRIYNMYMDIYNRKRQLYKKAIPKFHIYLENKHEIRVVGWERNGFLQFNPDTLLAEETSINKSANRRNQPGSRIPSTYKRTYGGKSKKHRNSKKHRKSNKRK